MCIISILGKGTQKDSPEVIKFITNGFNNNYDGSGFMLKRNNTDYVYFSKGYFNLNSLLDDIKNQNLQLDDELVVHHRIGNVGNVGIINCHPFACSNDEKIINNHCGEVKVPVLVHNGTFSNVTPLKELNKGSSDTYAVSRYIFGDENIINMLKTNLKVLDIMMIPILNTGKLCMLFPDRDLLKTSNFIEDNGYFHSNEGYKDDWYRDVGGYLKKKESYVERAINNLFTSSNNKVANKKQTKLALNNDFKYIDKINNILDNVSVTLDGSLIRINNFNYKDFIYCFNTVGHIHYDKAFTFTSFSETRKLNILKVKNNNDILKIPITEHSLHVNLDFLPTNSMNAIYRDYLMLLKWIEPSNKVMKSIYNQLNNSRFKSLETKILVSKIGQFVSRKALIEYFNYYKDEYIRGEYRLTMKAIYDYVEVSVTTYDNTNTFPVNAVDFRENESLVEAG